MILYYVVSLDRLFERYRLVWGHVETFGIVMTTFSLPLLMVAGLELTIKNRLITFPSHLLCPVLMSILLQMSLENTILRLTNLKLLQSQSLRMEISRNLTLLFNLMDPFAFLLRKLARHMVMV